MVGLKPPWLTADPTPSESPSDSTVPVTDEAAEFVAMTIREASLMADVVTRYLDTTGLFPPLEERRDRPVGLPRNFLLHLGAVLRLAMLERAGLRALVDPSLPSASEAFADLAERAVNRPESFAEVSDSNSLLGRVLLACLRRLAWPSCPTLGADILIEHVDEDKAIDALAQLLVSVVKHGGPCNGD